MLNFPLLKNPLNWITVILMLLIPSIGLHFILLHYQNISTKES